MVQTSMPPISRFDTPTLEDLPQDIRDRILAVQEKAGFVPNVFLVLARRPDEFRAFIDANARDNVGRASTVKRFGAYDRAFNRVDQDGSGTVTWSEIMQGLAEAN